VVNHEMHHRKFTVNYAQYCMWYDHLAHSYTNYEGPDDSSKKLKKVDWTNNTAENGI
jgi:sterol desaturase/sphingolipid hydroxylase (fatty acid hydroxylase superfamily)